MFDKIKKFEEELAEFTGAPYAIMTDCCTHATILTGSIGKASMNSLTLEFGTQLADWNRICIGQAPCSV